MFWFWLSLFYGALFLIGLVTGFVVRFRPDNGGSWTDHEKIPDPTPSGGMTFEEFLESLNG
jgi:hypothetical protein